MIEIRVIGMMRSGHHAIINWIYQQAPTAIFQNDILHTQTGNDQWRKGENPKYWIYNIEDMKVGDALKTLKFRQGFGVGGRIITILVIRDFYNLLASRLQYNQKHKHSYTPIGWASREVTETWKDHVLFKHKVICVNFNLWFTNKDYRKELATKLELDFTDKGVDEVKSFGYGSSFDDMNFDGRATCMGVLERYKIFENCVKNISFEEVEIGNRFYWLDKEWEKLGDHRFRIVDPEMQSGHILVSRRMEEVEMNEKICVYEKDWIEWTKINNDKISRNGCTKIVGSNYMVEKDITPCREVCVENQRFMVKTPCGRFFELIDQEVISLNKRLFGIRLTTGML